MRSRRGIFWYSLGLTLLLLLPMVLTVAFFTDQYQKQQLLRQASAAEDSLRVEPGAQGVFRLLLVVQQDKPAFVLARVDGPQQAVTLCALPGSLLVDAPAGRTTLAECALSAGAGRAAQLLGNTVATGESALRVPGIVRMAAGLSPLYIFWYTRNRKPISVVRLLHAASLAAPSAGVFQ